MLKGSSSMEATLYPSIFYETRCRGLPSTYSVYCLERLFETVSRGVSMRCAPVHETRYPIDLTDAERGALSLASYDVPGC
jgi:hypothetical protein